MIKQVSASSRISVPVYLEGLVEHYQDHSCVAYGTIDASGHVKVEHVLLDGLSKPILGEWLDNHSYVYVAADLLKAAQVLGE